MAEGKVRSKPGREPARKQPTVEKVPTHSALNVVFRDFEVRVDACRPLAPACERRPLAGVRSPQKSAVRSATAFKSEDNLPQVESA